MIEKYCWLIAAKQRDCYMISNVIAMFSTKNSTRLGIDGDDSAGWSGTAMGAVAHLPRKARTDGPVDRQAHLPDLPLVSDSNRHWGPPTSLSIEFPSFCFHAKKINSRDFQ